uniref:Uncharacterized protein n=1 Tax=Arundo donax TaxID=35708 RepID=A0A0A8Y0E6_ARUDO
MAEINLKAASNCSLCSLYAACSSPTPAMSLIYHCSIENGAITMTRRVRPMYL